MQRGRSSMAGCWRGSVCWDRDRRILPQKRPGVEAYTESQGRSCRNSVSSSQGSPTYSPIVERASRRRTLHIISMPWGIRECKARKRKTQRPGAMEEAYATVTDPNATLRHAAVLPSLVYGIGVFARHHDRRVSQRRDGQKRDPPHIPSYRSARL